MPLLTSTSKYVSQIDTTLNTALGVIKVKLMFTVCYRYPLSYSKFVVKKGNIFCKINNSLITSCINYSNWNCFETTWRQQGGNFLYCSNSLIVLFPPPTTFVGSWIHFHDRRMYHFRTASVINRLEMKWRRTLISSARPRCASTTKSSRDVRWNAKTPNLDKSSFCAGEKSVSIII